MSIRTSSFARRGCARTIWGGFLLSSLMLGAPGCGMLAMSGPGSNPGGGASGSDATAAAHFEPLVRATTCEAEEAGKTTKLALSALVGPRPPERIASGMPCLSALSSGAVSVPQAPPVALPVIDPSGLSKKNIAELLDAIRKERLKLSIEVDDFGNVEVRSAEVKRLQAELAGKSPRDPGAAARAKTAMRMSALSDLVQELRARLAFAGRAFREANLAAQTANARALSLVFHAIMAERHGGDVNAEAQRPRFEKMVTAMRQSERLAAASTGLIATVQAALDRGTSGKVVLDAALELETALARPAEVPAAEAEAIWKQGSDKAAQMQAEIDEWSRSERAKRGMPPAQPSNKQISLAGADEESDASAALGGVLALMAGDYGGALEAASVLFPKDSPIRHGMRAAGSVLRGDYKGALASATKMVPADSSVGQALATAQTALALAP